ncbi:TadE/TadG family type IV pilus assembly protein [Maioricimonas sp. JC845]|uniref:TadE/TadG family type IV pilus assembly protein n=1 Tax=Maioricimonas sp. JC845 TaxID=3232138 RepID=UPI00345B0F61
MPPRPDRSTIRSVGQLVVDITLLLPVFVILTCGLVEFSRAIAVQQAMQDAVDGTSGADVAVAGDSELEGAIRATVAESAGADADQVDVTSDGPVVTVALPDETLGAGPVRFLDGTTLSARASAGK